MKETLKKLILSNFSMHIMHQCYTRTRLLSFDKSRKNCQERLRQASRKYRGEVLNYCILEDQIQVTINGSSDQVTDIIRYTSSATAADYSLRTDREGPFWKPKYKITMIEKGIHLLRLSLMMDRAMIDREECLHQGEWKFSGYNDLIGIRKRYTIADTKKIAKLTGFRNENDFRQWYIECSAEMSESLSGTLHELNKATVVGSLELLKSIAVMLPRGWSKIDILVNCDKAPTHALYLSDKRRRAFTRSFKN
jgi:REP element-mobilizing transposase RayT